MPTYVFKCPRCSVTAERLRKIEERDEPVECVECKAAMARMPAPPQGSFPGADSWRTK